MTTLSSLSVSVGRAAGLSLLLGLLCSCASAPLPVNAFRLGSPGLVDNAMLAQKNGGNNKANPNCAGQNVSPELQWSKSPENTRSFAIVMDDQAGRDGLGVSHWVAYGIPASITALAEGEASGSKNFVGGRNTLGTPSYFGPCPPHGNAPQHYVFTIIATNLEAAALPPGLSKTELLESLKGHTLGAASLVLRYAH